MATLTEKNEWTPTVFQIEYETKVIGGVPEYTGGVPTGGWANVSAQQLANRTQFLLSKVVNNELSVVSIETKVIDNQAEAQQHYGSVGVTAHGLASSVAPGFMSVSHYDKVEGLASVASTGSYHDLNNKPPIYLSLRSSDFVASVGYRYYIKQNLQVTLADPAAYGYIDGDFIQFLKSPTVSPHIVSTSSAQIVTSAGTTNDLIFDVDDEITLVFDGTNWRI